MTPFAWLATALTSIVLAWLAASPQPRASAVPTARSSSSDDALLARVEREVTGPLRERAMDRWRFSRVHRPTPAYRTVADPERSDRRHAAFRVSVADRIGEAERVAWLVRVHRESGTIELAQPLPPGSREAPRWTRHAAASALEALAPPR